MFNVTKKSIQWGNETLTLESGKVARQAERGRDRAAMVRHDAGRRVDGQRGDLFRRVVRDGFDIHAAFGRHDQRVE